MRPKGQSTRSEMATPPSSSRLHVFRSHAHTTAHPCAPHACHSLRAPKDERWVKRDLHLLQFQAQKYGQIVVPLHYIPPEAATAALVAAVAAPIAAFGVPAVAAAAPPASSPSAAVGSAAHARAHSAGESRSPKLPVAPLATGSATVANSPPGAGPEAGRLGSTARDRLQPHDTPAPTTPPPAATRTSSGGAAARQRRPRTAGSSTKGHGARVDNALAAMSSSATIASAVAGEGVYEDLVAGPMERRPTRGGPPSPSPAGVASTSPPDMRTRTATASPERPAASTAQPPPPRVRPSRSGNGTDQLSPATVLKAAAAAVHGSEGEVSGTTGAPGAGPPVVAVDITAPVLPASEPMPMPRPPSEVSPTTSSPTAPPARRAARKGPTQKGTDSARSDTASCRRESSSGRSGGGGDSEGGGDDAFTAAAGVTVLRNNGFSPAAAAAGAVGDTAPERPSSRRKHTRQQATRPRPSDVSTEATARDADAAAAASTSAAHAQLSSVPLDFVVPPPPPHSLRPATGGQSFFISFDDVGPAADEVDSSGGHLGGTDAVIQIATTSTSSRGPPPLPQPSGAAVPPPATPSVQAKQHGSPPADEPAAAPRRSTLSRLRQPTPHHRLSHHPATIAENAPPPRAPSPANHGDSTPVPKVPGGDDSAATTTFPAAAALGDAAPFHIARPPMRRVSSGQARPRDPQQFQLRHPGSVAPSDASRFRTAHSRRTAPSAGGSHIVKCEHAHASEHRPELPSSNEAAVGAAVAAAATTSASAAAPVVISPVLPSSSAFMASRRFSVSSPPPIDPKPAGPAVTISSEVEAATATITAASLAAPPAAPAALDPMPSSNRAPEGSSVEAAEAVKTDGADAASATVPLPLDPSSSRSLASSALSLGPIPPPTYRLSAGGPREGTFDEEEGQVLSDSESPFGTAHATASVPAVINAPTISTATAEAVSSTPAEATGGVGAPPTELVSELPHSPPLQGLPPPSNGGDAGLTMDTTSVQTNLFGNTSGAFAGAVPLEPPLPGGSGSADTVTIEGAAMSPGADLELEVFKVEWVLPLYSLTGKGAKLEGKALRYLRFLWSVLFSDS